MRILTLLLIYLLAGSCAERQQQEVTFQVMTVRGPISADQLGNTLIHEHILVDFIGADSISQDRWNGQEVQERVLPYLLEVKELGCESMFECTPAYLGRDPVLLRNLSEAAGMYIITNTGYYGARNNKFIPAHGFEETAEELAQRWIDEWKNGIEGTGIKPGFIKIGVDRDSLSVMHQKLVRAAALTHLATGLTIASHTGFAVPAFQEIQILKEEGVSPAAFIWVHAQNEKDLNNHVVAARQGTWISLDGVSDKNVDRYVEMISNLRANGLLDVVLISHDAGWYRPGEEGGGKFRPYTAVYEHLIPELKKNQFSEEEIRQLFVENPAAAFGIRVRNL